MNLDIRLRLLLDTNVFIAVEPFSGSFERGLAPGARLLRTVVELGHQLFVHRANVDDIREDRDVPRRSQRLAELGKYSMLDDSPIPDALLDLAGTSRPGTNDYNDLRLLAALYSHAATHLVSADVRLRGRAGRAGLGDAVLTIDEAIELLRRFAPQPYTPPPRVEQVPAYSLDVAQSIFESLRGDYDGFDQWLDKIRDDWQNRTCFVIRDGETYAAVALLKREKPGGYGFPEPVLKLTTIKVGDGYAGSKYGELLLKAVFHVATASRASSIYVETFAKQALLIQMLGEFGFEETYHRTDRGELVLLKRRNPTDDQSHLDDLAFHVRYGPPALRIGGSAFVVPIEPRWHEQLFPDCPPPHPMLPGLGLENHTFAWGNALRKAYLSHSNIQKLTSGDILLFYRSRDTGSVAVVGVVERTLRSRDPIELLTFVGRRTVYSPRDIAEMCQGVRPVLAVLFRQDRLVEPPWRREDLNTAGVITSWPQTLAEVPEQGRSWLRQQIGGL